MKTTQEEADIIMIQQLFTAARGGAKVVKVICDDTDVFSLQCRHQQIHKLNVTILMEETHLNKEVIDIKESIAQNADVIESLLLLLAIIGCDSVPTIYAIEKKTAMKVLQKKRSN